MKICSYCGIEKEYSEFHIDKTKKDGYKSRCKSCRNKEKRNNKHLSLDKEISRSMYRALKRNKEGYIWERVIGISLQELKKHIENQFDDVMSWDNYGKYWVVDKIIPTSVFNYSGFRSNEFMKAWNIKNLRPYPRNMHNRRTEKVIWKLVDYYNLYDILPAGLLGDNICKTQNFQN